MNMQNLVAKDLKAIASGIVIDIEKVSKNEVLSKMGKVITKKIKFNELIFHEIQYHSIDEASIKGLAEDISVKGLIEPLTVSKNNIILSGNTRYLSLKLLGFTSEEITCVIYDKEYKIDKSKMSNKEILEFRGYI